MKDIEKMGNFSNHLYAIIMLAAVVVIGIATVVSFANDLQDVVIDTTKIQQGTLKNDVENNKAKIAEHEKKCDETNAEQNKSIAVIEIKINNVEKTLVEIKQQNAQMLNMMQKLIERE